MAGRKCKYNEYVEPYLDKIIYWRKDGLTEEQIARKLRIAYSTLKEYKNRYSALMSALKTGKEDLIAELEKSLYKRGMGFEYEEVKTYVEKDESGREKKKVEKTKKFLAPDTGALIFALKNLRSDKWKDKPLEEGNNKDKEGINDFIKATTMNEKEVKELFKGDIDEQEE